MTSAAVLRPRPTARPLARAAAATPATRDRYVDFLRVASILVVIAGHWLMALVFWRDGRLAGGNALALLPGAWLLTWVLQVMPVFFFVGGFSNLVALDGVRRRGGGYVAYLSGRVARLLRPTTAFVLAWVALPPLLAALGVPDAGLRAAAKLVAQPLWFLAVYLAVVALAPPMVRLHRRFRYAVPAALAAGALAVDVARLGFGVRDAGYLNLLLVWLFVQQLGFFYADGTLGRCSRGRLAAVAAGGLAALAVLVGSGAYPGSMVGMPGAPVSNMSPPTVCILALALWQVGLLGLARRRVTAWLGRPRVWAAVITAGSMTMTLFLWHLTALLALVALLVGVGIALPEPLSGAWWASRPLWLAGLVAVLVPLAMMLARFERPAPLEPPAPAAESPRGRLAAALGAGYLALAILGLVASGFHPLVAPEGAALLGLRVDPLQSLAHLALGAWLVRSARDGTAAGRAPWAVAAGVSAVLALPAVPLLAGSLAGSVLHGATALLACTMLASGRKAVPA